jgi:glycosyltransferase involved in cell wall biosynthesis
MEVGGNQMSGLKTGTKVLMLLSNPATFDRRPLKEATALSSNGYDVTILAWDRQRSASPFSRPARGLDIQRFPLRSGYGQSPRTVFGFALYYAWCVLIARRRRFRVIHCHDVDTLFCGVILKLLSGKPTRLVYDMHDLPNVFLSSFPGSKYLVRLVYLTAARFVDRLVVVNDRVVDYLSNQGLNRGKMAVVMNVPNESNLARHQRNRDVFRVLYYGSLNRQKGVQNLVTATHGLDDVLLVLAGRGDLTDWISEVQRSTNNVVSLGWIPLAKLEDQIRAADLIPILYVADNPNAVLAAPGKLFDAIYRGIPVIANHGTYFADLIQQNDCGLVVDGDDPSTIRSAIVRFRDDLELYTRLSENGLRLAKTKFSWETSKGNLLSMYSELTTKPPSSS